MTNEHLHDKVRRMHRLSVALADRLIDRLPPDTAELLREFISVGEYGPAAEVLCATLAKRGIAVTPDEYAALTALGAEVDGPSYQPSSHLRGVVVRDKARVDTVTTPDEPRKFFIRPPENFYEMSEEEQLNWTRQVGEELKAASDTERKTQGEDEDTDKV